MPWGTLIVNVSGALAIGLVFTILVRRYEVALWIQEAVLVGFLGGYTTFSALSLETYVMIEHRRFGVALAYVGGSVALGIVAVFVGIRLGRAIS